MSMCHFESLGVNRVWVLADIAKGMPKNAKYTYKDIQNEIIETLTNMVHGEVRRGMQMLTWQGFG